MQVNFNLEELIEFKNVLKDVKTIVFYITNETSYLIHNNLHILIIENYSNKTINNILLQFKK